MNEYHAEEPAPGFDHWWELRFNPGYYDYEVLDGDDHRAGRDRPGGLRDPRRHTRGRRLHRGGRGQRGPLLPLGLLLRATRVQQARRGGLRDRTAQVLAGGLALFENAAHPPPARLRRARHLRQAPALAGLPPPGAAGARIARANIRCNLAAVHRVDAGVGEILAALGEAGIEDDTAILFISDNGYFFGEHRRPSEKAVPYEAALEVPMAAHIPRGVLEGRAVTTGRRAHRHARPRAHDPRARRRRSLRRGWLPHHSTGARFSA